MRNYVQRGLTKFKQLTSLKQEEDCIVSVVSLTSGLLGYIKQALAVFKQ